MIALTYQVYGRFLSLFPHFCGVYNFSNTVVLVSNCSSFNRVTDLQGICDGAGAVVIASEEAITKYNLTPLARVVDYSVAGVDPTIMGIGPVFAIRDLLRKVNLTLDDIDLLEVC